MLNANSSEDLNINTKNITIDGENVKVGGISFDDSAGIMYVGKGENIYALNADGTSTKIIKTQKGTSQDFLVKDGYIYVSRFNNEGKDNNRGINTPNDTNSNLNASRNIIDIYTTAGKYVGSHSISTGDDNYELESISYSSQNDKFTLYFNHQGTRGGSIGEVTIPTNRSN